MIKNKIKAIEIGFLIVCILPTFSYALDKEDILEYLVKSSYPEVKVIDDEDNNKNNNDSDKKSENNKDEFINVYVGEENVPETKSEESKEASNLIDSQYKNDTSLQY